MSSLQGKEILIIDDAEDVRLLASKILENDGALVSQSSDIQRGLELVFQAQPHLIVLDLQFEGTTGFDFLSIRRNEPRLQSIPVLVLSAVKDRVGVTQAISLGAKDYLLKPFRATQLLQKVRKILHVASFAAYDIPADQAPEVEMTVSAQIVNFTECGFGLESSVKFAPEHSVRVQCEALDALTEEKALLRISNRAPVYVGPSRYSNQILFTGVGEMFVKKLRKAIGG